MTEDNWFDDFLLWEKKTKDVIDFKKAYVDMASCDLIAGLMLSEIVYWNLPDKNGDSKLRVEHEGKKWIACRRYEWWDRTRITPDQADRALRILREEGLIETRVFKFDGNPTVHVRILPERFRQLWNEIIHNDRKNPFLPIKVISVSTENDLANNGKGNPQEAKTLSVGSQNDLGSNPISLTEGTAKDTTQITNTVSADALVASPTNGNGIVKNPGALKALEGWYSRKDQWDFSDFSESIRETIQVFCELWNVAPPARSKRRGGQFSLWEQEAAELQYACGEFKTDALRAYYEDWKKIKPEKKFIPGRPGSLTYYVNAKAAEMRTSKKGSSKPVPTRAEFSQYVLDVGDPDIEDTDHDFRLWLKQQGVQTA